MYPSHTVPPHNVGSHNHISHITNLRNSSSIPSNASSANQASPTYAPPPQSFSNNFPSFGVASQPKPLSNFPVSQPFGSSGGSLLGLNASGSGANPGNVQGSTENPFGSTSRGSVFTGSAISGVEGIQPATWSSAESGISRSTGGGSGIISNSTCESNVTFSGDKLSKLQALKAKLKSQAVQEKTQLQGNPSISNTGGEDQLKTFSQAKVAEKIFKKVNTQISSQRAISLSNSSVVHSGIPEQALHAQNAQGSGGSRDGRLKPPPSMRQQSLQHNASDVNQQSNSGRIPAKYASHWQKAIQSHNRAKQMTPDQVRVVGTTQQIVNDDPSLITSTGGLSHGDPSKFTGPTCNATVGDFDAPMSFEELMKRKKEQQMQHAGGYHTLRSSGAPSTLQKQQDITKQTSTTTARVVAVSGSLKVIRTKSVPKVPSGIKTQITSQNGLQTRPLTASDATRQHPENIDQNSFHDIQEHHGEENKQSRFSLSSTSTIFTSKITNRNDAPSQGQHSTSLFGSKKINDFKKSSNGTAPKSPCQDVSLFTVSKISSGTASTPSQHASSIQQGHQVMKQLRKSGAHISNKSIAHKQNSCTTIASRDLTVIMPKGSLQMKTSPSHPSFPSSKISLVEIGGVSRLIQSKNSPQRPPESTRSVAKPLSTTVETKNTLQRNSKAKSVTTEIQHFPSHHIKAKYSTEASSTPKVLLGSTVELDRQRKSFGASSKMAACNQLQQTVLHKTPSKSTNSSFLMQDSGGEATASSGTRNSNLHLISSSLRDPNLEKYCNAIVGNAESFFQPLRSNIWPASHYINNANSENSSHKNNDMLRMKCMEEVSQMAKACDNRIFRGLKTLECWKDLPDMRAIKNLIDVSEYVSSNEVINSNKEAEFSESGRIIGRTCDDLFQCLNNHGLLDDHISAFVSNDDVILKGDDSFDAAFLNSWCDEVEIILKKCNQETQQLKKRHRELIQQTA